MILFEPTMPRPFEKPDCPECGTAMWLFGIESDELGHELFSFDCPVCHHIETATQYLNRRKLS